MTLRRLEESQAVAWAIDYGFCTIISSLKAVARVIMPIDFREAIQSELWVFPASLLVTDGVDINLRYP
jgi:hypothetical protein